MLRTSEEKQAALEAVRKLSVPLDRRDELHAIVDEVKSARCVLLGEASHGTSEFYTMRTELTKQLILEKGFQFIAVEGDWPSCFEVNRYIKGFRGAAASAEEALQAFDRWPTWMWKNMEVCELVEWLKKHNEGLPADQKVGFYGLDVYSLWESMEAVMQYLEQTGSPHLEEAKKAFGCFEPYGREGQNYGIAASLYAEGCEDEVVQMLTKLRTKRGLREDPEEAAIDTEINGLVALHAEQYYRAMITDDVGSWNIRDRHMVEALMRTAAFYGEGSKMIVWEHNTHVGDARATDMLREGMVNVGQLVREQLGREAVYAVGFGTYAGRVIAAERWGYEAEAMEVPAGKPGSWEELLHEAGERANRIVLFAKDEGAAAVLEGMVIGHRAIGVSYHPHDERGNYVPTILPKRYDAFVHVDHTNPVQQLGVLVH